MSTDVATDTIEVDAPPAQVLATLRDVAAQPHWVREVTSVDLLDTDEQGRPATARVTATTPMGTDEYTLAYEHTDEGMSWSMVEGRLQTGQDGHYTLEGLDDDRTRVTFELAISHNLPLPGFLTRQVVNGVVTGTLAGLKRYVEEPAGSTH
ncbi:MAG TPA: SRPBCC family protein [Actinomycetes bacterium]|nr:SRPBCC family protein [Actinomycetes bacterium]